MVRRQQKQAKQVFNIKAVENERNIDLFANYDSGMAKTVYFNKPRDIMVRGEESKARPGYRLEEVRRYVLGTIYIWALKDSTLQNIAA